MLILSLDSAGSSCGVCVWRDGTVLAAAQEQMERGQDQRLMPLIMEMMKKAGVTFEQLDRVAVTRGPGSFTGLRIGLAAARGVGLAANKPVIGIDRFSLYREHVKTADKNLLVVINSKRKELYCRFYPAQGAGTEPDMMDMDAVTDFLKQNPDTLMTGDMQQTIPETIVCAALAAQADMQDPAYAPRPLYIRPPDVTMKGDGIVLRPVMPPMTPQLVTLHAEGFGTESWNYQQLLGSLSLDTTQGWVAFDKDKAVGFILMQALPDEQEILTFCVAASHRRRKIGEKLLQRVIDQARTNGAESIFLDVAADNHAAIALYQKSDFMLSGSRPNYYTHADKTVDGLLFVLNLTAD